ncbi:hypothetical protein YPPY54_2640, partial [Yersinia pestis PY-54]|jgi:hypothetical protein
MFAS